MFGTLRYFLAMMVVVGHLWPQLVPNMGSYAVFAFYTLSGYLMTLVLKSAYRHANGTWHFLTNRALRIYPPYIAVLFMSIIIFYSIRTIPEEFNFFRLPVSYNDWLKNIFIFGLKAGAAKPKLVGVAWTLYVELFYYVTMAFFLVRTRITTIIWFCASILFTGYTIVRGYDFALRYETLIAGSLPFSTGAMIYLFKDELRIITKKYFIIIIALYSLNLVLTRRLGWEYMNLAGLYVSYILSACAIIYLADVSSVNRPRWFAQFDQFLGDLSYPIYLCHWPVAIYISCIFYSGILPRSSRLFFVSIIFINVISLIIHVLIEKNVNRVRARVKTQGIHLRLPPSR